MKAKQFSTHEYKDWHPHSQPESEYYSYISMKQEKVARAQKKKLQEAIDLEIQVLEETLWDE